MKRRTLILSAVGMLAVPLGAVAQAKMHRIGYVGSTDPKRTSQLEGLRRGLREHGLVEGQNLVIEYVWREGIVPQDAAEQLVRSDVELIFVWGTPALAAAKQATTRIPIVFVGVGDPIGAGLVSNFARPGGNITGMTNNARDISAKRLQLLVEIVPGNNRVAVLGNPANFFTASQMKELEPAARSMGIKLSVVEARVPDDLDGAFARAASGKPAGMVVLAEPMFVAHRQRMIALEHKHRLPCIYAGSDNPRAGGLMSYGVNADEMFRRGARYVALILRGAKPGDLPIEQPTQYELFINLKTAKVLGITVPPTLLLRADRVIE